MSIVNKAAEESIRQSRLFSQLADVSYKAVNGKRQNIRDFAKGMLNIGKLGEQMDVPKDEITKDMILDYKREQEEKLYDGNKLYQKPELVDNLQEYKPLYSGDEVDVEKKKKEINNLQELRKKYINMNKAIETEIIEIKKRLDYFSAITGGNRNIDATIPEIAFKREELVRKEAQKQRILENLADVENQFRNKYTEALQARENVKANEKELARINDENKRLIKDYGEKFNILNRDRVSITKQPNETDEEYFQRIKELEATTVDPNIYKDKAALEEIKKLKRNLKDILKDPSKIEDIVKSFPNPQDIYIININWKKISEFLKTKYGVNSRFTTVKEYIDDITETLINIRNNAFNVTQTRKVGARQVPGQLGQVPGQPILSSAFMNPILARQAALQQDITLYNTRLPRQEARLPQASLSLLPRDEAQQQDIARVREAEAEVQTRAARAAVEAIREREAPAMTFAQAQAAQAAAAGAEAGAAGPRSRSQSIASSTSIPAEQLYTFRSDQTLYFKSDNGQDVYIKIGKFNRKLYILYSLSGDENSFNSFEFDDLEDPNYFDRILKRIGLLDIFNYPTDIYNQVFGMFNKRDIYNYLKNDVGLKETPGLKERTNTQGKTLIGWGLKKSKAKSKTSKRKKVIKGRGMQQIEEENEFEHKEEVPKVADFGNKKILLNKLFYRNILSIKDKKGHSVEKLPNTTVSDEFVKIIMMAYNDPDQNKLIKNIQNLEESEQELLNLLLFISGLNKKKNIDIKRPDNVKKLKDRLQLVEAQIKAGNNNPVVKKELKDIVNKLYLFGAISMNSAKEFLKQY
jgi:hypothetical protein